MRLITRIYITLTVLLPTAVLAESPTEGLRDAAGRAGLPMRGAGSGEGLAQMIGSLVSAALGLVGVVFLVLLVYGGFLWMTAGGNEEKVTKAKKLLGNSIIGIIIIFAAYAISNFVLSNVLTATGVTSGT